MASHVAPEQPNGQQPSSTGPQPSSTGPQPPTPQPPTPEKQPSPPPPYSRPARQPRSPLLPVMPWQGLKKAFHGDGSGRLLWPHTPWQVAAIFAAELMGTALLLFFGCMGQMEPLGKTGEAMHLQGGLAFGFVVGMQITVFGHASTAHFNPAVSLCSLMLGKIRIATFFVYLVAEMLGATLGMGALKALTPSNATCNCTTVVHDSLSGLQGFFVEFLATAMLIFVVCGVWDSRSEALGSFDAVPLKFAITIAGLALVAGPWTGASMNPARSFAPALFEGTWGRHWVYWAGPMLGSIFATLYYTYFLNTDKVRRSYPVEEVRLTAVKNDTGNRQEE